MSSIQECYNALEQGHVVTLWDASTLRKLPTGEYVYTPSVTSSIVAVLDPSLICRDLGSLFAHIVLREAVCETPYIEADRELNEWARMRGALSI